MVCSVGYSLTTQAISLISAAATTLNPDFMRPREAPPAPQNKSMAVRRDFKPKSPKPSIQPYRDRYL